MAYARKSSKFIHPELEFALLVTDSCIMVSRETGSKQSSPLTSIPRADILGVSDLEVWQYSCALRQLARSNNCDNLQFARLCDLVGDEIFPEPRSEEAYLEVAPKIRNEIMAQFMPPDFDVVEAIACDPDVTATYCGYAKFLSLELAEVLNAMNVPNTQKRRYCKEVAQRMIFRGRVSAPSTLQV
jgi:pyoverdine/dityrosine biosynthesis protein Dit1